MERQQLCSRIVVIRLALLLHAFCCAGLMSHRSILAGSFVLRGGPSIVQLADVADLNDDADLREDDDDEDDSFVDQLSPLDLERLTEEVKYQSPTGYENNFDGGQPANEYALGDDSDESDATLTDLVMETMGHDVVTAPRYVSIYDDDDQQVNDVEDDEDQLPDGGLTTLNKSQLHQLFDQTKADDEASQASEAADVAKRSELTKNEVEQLFEKSTDVELTEAKQPESISLAPVVVVAAAGNSSSSSDSELIVVPTVKVTTVQELVKSVDQGRSDGGKESDVTLDVKEEKLFPGTSEKTTKEWMIELERPDDDDTGAAATSGWMIESGGNKGSRKFKRSPQVEDGELLRPSSFERASEKAAKSHAVELLKTYIQLQEDENRHLTQALNMATLGQTERSDSFIGREIDYLKQAVKDEKALETIRDLIRDEEGNDGGDDEEEDENENEEAGEEEEQGVYDTLDSGDDDDNDNEDVDASEYTVDNGELTFGVKRGLLGNEDLDVREPSILPFGDIEDGDADEEEQVERVEDNEDEDEFMKDELRQYILRKQLDSIRQSARDAAAEEDLDDDWTPEEDLSAPKPYRTTFREPVRLNPFARDIEDLYQDRNFVLEKRQYIDIQGYDDEPVSDVVPIEDELAEARQEIADAVALGKILQSNPADDVSDDEAEEFIEQLTGTEICPAVQELTDNCLAARERGLVLDSEALLLCNRHQLCYSCGYEYGLTPEVCDRGYLAEADRLCTLSASSGRSRSRCKTEATGLYVIMLDGHRYHNAAEPGYSLPPVCRQRCAYDFVLGSTSRR